MAAMPRCLPSLHQPTVPAFRLASPYSLRRIRTIDAHQEFTPIGRQFLMELPASSSHSIMTGSLLHHVKHAQASESFGCNTMLLTRHGMQTGNTCKTCCQDPL
jgi:hypothetical protein